MLAIETRTGSLHKVRARRRFHGEACQLLLVHKVLAQNFTALRRVQVVSNRGEGGALQSRAVLNVNGHDANVLNWSSFSGRHWRLNPGRDNHVASVTLLEKEADLHGVLGVSLEGVLHALHWNGSANHENDANKGDGLAHLLGFLKGRLRNVRNVGNRSRQLTEKLDLVWLHALVSEYSRGGLFEGNEAKLPLGSELLRPREVVVRSHMPKEGTVDFLAIIGTPNNEGIHVSRAEAQGVECAWIGGRAWSWSRSGR